MLTLYDQSTGTATATVTDQAGAAVNDATVTLAITTQDGRAVLAAAAMTSTGSGGTYTYTVASTLLSRGVYLFTVLAIRSGVNRLAEVEVLVTRDRS